MVRVPLGRKTCNRCGEVSFDAVALCPNCGVDSWWEINQLGQQRFLVDRKSLGLLFRGIKLEDRCSAKIASRIAAADAVGFSASDSVTALDPWHTTDGKPRSRPSCIVVDTSRGLVKVFRVDEEEVTETTFNMSDIAKVIIDVEPSSMVRPAPGSPAKLVLAGALVGGAAGVVSALLIQDLLGVFRSSEVVNFVFSVHFRLRSGAEVFISLLKDGYVRNSGTSESGFTEFVGRVADAESRWSDFLTRYFSRSTMNGAATEEAPQAADEQAAASLSASGPAPDVPQTSEEQVLEVEACSLDEARRLLLSRKPPHLHLLCAIEILSNGQPMLVTGAGASTAEALLEARGKVPPEAKIFRERELAPVGESRLTIKAYDEDGARRKIVRRLAKGAIIKKVVLREPGGTRLLGMGRKPNLYEAVVLQQALVELDCGYGARIRARLGPPPSWAAP